MAVTHFPLFRIFIHKIIKPSNHKIKKTGFYSLLRLNEVRASFHSEYINLLVLWPPGTLYSLTATAPSTLYSTLPQPHCIEWKLVSVLML